MYVTKHEKLNLQYMYRTIYTKKQTIYFVSQLLCICIDNHDGFSMRKDYFFYCNDLIFLLFNNLMKNRHCI
jgi:hypothetical protein